MKIQTPPRCHSCESKKPVRPLKQNNVSQFMSNNLFFSTFSWVPAFAGMTAWVETYVCILRRSDVKETI